VWAAQDILTARESSAAPAALGPLETAARLARLWAQHCGGEISYGQALPHLLTLAGEALPHLHPDDAREAWARIAQSPCAQALSAPERAWVELFTASAARDAVGMASVGSRILQGDRASRNPGSEYAFLATMTGLLCLGENERAKAVMAAGAQSWLRPGSARTELAYLEGRASSPPLVRCSVPQAPADPARQLFGVPRGPLPADQGRQLFGVTGKPLPK
jgi:hypothetical protein